MYIVHCHYSGRHIKKLINKLLAGGIPRVAKINYSKSYTPDDKKTQVTKEHILYIYEKVDQKAFVASFIEKNMKDCFTTFMTTN
jgi:hypothetical protein